LDFAAWWLALGAALALAAAPARAAQPGMLPFAAEERALPNGLAVVVVPYESAGLVAVATIVRAGSRLEPAGGPSGLAHAVEHMAFRGGQRYDAAAYARLMQSLGAESAAETSDDWTGYFVTAPAAALERVLEAEADRLTAMAFTATDFRLEAAAIQGEFRRDAADPGSAARALLRGLAFPLGGYGHDPIGRAADVAALPQAYDAALAFYRQWYRPGHATVIVVGDVEPARAAALVERAFGGWSGSAPAIEPPVEGPQAAPRGAVKRDWPVATQPVVLVAWRAPGLAGADPAAAAEFAALDVAVELLFGPVSPLARDLAIERREAESIAVELPVRRDPYLAVVELRGAAGRGAEGSSADLLRSAVRQAALAWTLAPPDAARVEAVKSRRRALFRRQLDSGEGVARALAPYTALPGGLASLARYEEALAAVTPEAVQAAAARWLVDAGVIEVIVERGLDAP
jgi:zinc protease